MNNLFVQRIQESRGIELTDSLTRDTFNKRTNREFTGGNNKSVFSRPGYTSMMVKNPEIFLKFVDNHSFYVNECAIVVSNNHPRWNEIINFIQNNH